MKLMKVDLWNWSKKTLRGSKRPDFDRCIWHSKGKAPSRIELCRIDLSPLNSLLYEMWYSWLRSKSKLPKDASLDIRPSNKTTYRWNQYWWARQVSECTKAEKMALIVIICRTPIKQIGQQVSSIVAFLPSPALFATVSASFSRFSRSRLFSSAAAPLF
jgi:hypothetical protein